MNPMPAIPESTRISLAQRLHTHASTRWLLADVTVRYRAGFAYIDGRLPGGEVLPLCRRGTAGPHRPGDSLSTSPTPTATKTRSCPPAAFAGTPEDALDCAAALYLSDPGI